MSENALQKTALLIASKLGHRLFRNNVGVGWVGKSVRINTNVMVQCYPGDVIIRQARPLHAGLIEGSSDLVGFSNKGLFIAIETKEPGHHTAKDRLEKQQNFIDQVNSVGGIAGFAENEQDVKNILNKPCII